PRGYALRVHQVLVRDSGVRPDPSQVARRGSLEGDGVHRLDVRPVDLRDRRPHRVTNMGGGQWPPPMFLDTDSAGVHTRSRNRLVITLSHCEEAPVVRGAFVLELPV